MTVGHGRAVVLDNGSSACKVGFAGDREPSAVVPAVAGNPRVALQQVGGTGTRVKVGDKALNDPSLRLSHPIEHGVVTNWEELEELWREAFAQLEVCPAQHPVLLTEAALNPKVHREMMAMLLFEDFQVPAVHVALSGALGLYATGGHSGLVVEVGDGVAQTVPIYDNYIVPHAVHRVDMGGRDLTEHMATMLRDRDYLDASFHGTAAVRGLKEQHGYVAQNFSQELSVASLAEKEQSYILPDGKSIMVTDAELIRCPEVLFQPALALLKEDNGIHQMAFKSIRACDVDVQRTLAGNIVLSGGSTMFRGMRERMLKELSTLLPSSTQARVALVPEPMHGAFLGGSILSSLGSMQSNWISREDYEEQGVSVIHTRSISLTESGLRAQG